MIINAPFSHVCLAWTYQRVNHFLKTIQNKNIISSNSFRCAFILAVLMANSCDNSFDVAMIQTKKHVKYRSSRTENL